MGTPFSSRRGSFLACAVALATAIATGCGGGNGEDAGEDAAQASNEVNDVGTASASPGPLAADGRFFVDPASGDRVLLRGINLGGNAKLPPFTSVPGDDGALIDRALLARTLDLLVRQGFNSLRLPVFWEGEEPERGAPSAHYHEAVRTVVREAGRRGLWVVVDIHQDLFSRWAGKGCGSGFPKWAVPPGARAPAPANPGPGCGHTWGNETLSNGVGGSFRAFWANEGGVRDAFLAMIERLARALSEERNVVGFDLFNEPLYNLTTDLLGEGSSQLGRLYREAIARVRRWRPTDLAFLEGHIWTNNGSVAVSIGPGLPSLGMPLTLPPPSYPGAVYAPHVYHMQVMSQRKYDPAQSATFLTNEMRNVESVSRGWNAPAWIGEYGIFADTAHGDEYLDLMHARMNEAFFSGALWNAAPTNLGVSPFDGWNDEDLSIFSRNGDELVSRAFFRPSAYLERWPAAARISVRDVLATRPGEPRVLTLAFGPRTGAVHAVVVAPKAPERLPAGCAPLAPPRIACVVPAGAATNLAFAYR